MNQKKNITNEELIERISKLEQEIYSLEKKNLDYQNRVNLMEQEIVSANSFIKRFRKSHLIFRLNDSILERVKFISQKNLINQYHLFDEDYYRNSYPELKDYSHELIYHYLKYGWREYRNPCKEFDTSYYINHNKDVLNAKVIPLLHYIRYGYHEGRKPHEDTDMFNEWARFVQQQSTLKKKLYQYKSMYRIYRSGMFSGEYYLHEYPEVAMKLEKTFGWKLRGSKISLLRFCGKLLSTPIKHYVKYGMYEGLNPNSSFNTKYYLENYGDLRAASYVNLFEHYCYYGKAEGRTCKPKIQDTCFYLQQYVRHSEIVEKKHTISVILPYEGDEKEFAQRMSCVLAQTAQPAECIILHSDDNVKKNISNMCKGTSIKLVFRNSSDEYLNQEIIMGAIGDLLWVLEKDYSAENIFLETLSSKLQNKSVVMADCYCNKQLEHLNTSFLFNSDQTYYTIGKKEIEATDGKPVYRLSRMLFRNPKQYKDIANQDWNLSNEYGVQQFVIHYLAKGFFAHMNQRLVSYTEQTRVQKEHYDEQYMVLKDLYQIYHYHPERIKQMYEKLRTRYLSAEENELFEFIRKYPINEIFDYEYHPNVLIGIESFTHGGGEIMPIRLANELHEKGVHVYVHIKNPDVTEEKVRDMLNSEIPVFYTSQVDEIATIIDGCGIEVVNTHHQCLQSFYAMGHESFEQQGVRIYHVATSHGLYDQFEDSTLNYIFQNQLKDQINHWTYVADKNIEPFQKHNVYNRDDFIKIPNGMERPIITAILRTELHIPEGAFVFALASRAIPEKGWLSAIECVKQIQEQVSREVHLILIGEGPVYEVLKDSNIPSYVHLLGFRDNPCDYYHISDAVVLLSTYKSESAPLTLIEAMMVGKPIIASDIGDIKQMMTCNGKIAGAVYPLDQGKVPQNEVIEIMKKMIDDTDYYLKCCSVAQEKSKDFELSHIADLYYKIYRKSIENSDFGLANLYRNEISKSNELLAKSRRGDQTLKVSVIVPNYNHSKFLRQRLDCIYQQTYRNFEVILLDDCSKDNSREILKEYADRYPAITRYEPNETNSGGVFHQWCKGMRLATGDICWIAESDDFCERNFIEKLIPAFSDPLVNLSYCRYEFVNQNGQSKEFTFDSYVAPVSDTKWKSSYVNDSNNEVNEALSVINSIPNASGAMFRKPGKLHIFDEKRWLSMKICGDWVFYLYVIYGGKVAYSVDTRSYFRFHDNNSSASTYSRPEYYLEHAYVAETLRSLYGVGESLIQSMYERIEKFYNENVKDADMKFNQLFNLKEVLSFKKKEVEVITNQNEPDMSSKVKNGSAKKYETMIINPVKSGGTNLDSDVAEKVLYYGNNVGNMMFVESMKEQLIYEDDIFLIPQEDDRLDKYALVMPSSNFIIRGNPEFIENIQRFMDSVKGPFTLAGLGAQSNSKDDTPKKLVSELDPIRLRFFKALSERAVSIGVRGEFTAACLEEMGIHNYRIIGCPSAYMYLDGSFKMKQQPDAKRSVFTVTTKRPMESKIIDLGIQHNDQWIMQMMTEHPEIAFEGKDLSDDAFVRAFPKLNASKEELVQFMRTNAHMFFSYKEWCEFLQKNEISFSYGSRFHGNMCSLRNGVPSLWITHDSRTSELVNTLHLPSINYEQLEQVKCVEELVEFCNYDDFNKNYRRLTENYVEFLNENGLSHKFKL